nr:tRNA (guanosine(37)-N1)-methyltransferase TrmD [Deltaproteobacteria bacterium]NIS78472.1 tRNA (guanosine(37)-N1)-methyltransferase TrmD [Deltaproteobacteria bacterium]
EHVTGEFGRGTVVLLTPQGRRFDSALARELAGREHLILICGRYEGIDNRVSLHLADMEISMGDYVLTGGEIPAMALVDAVSRFVPGVVGTMESVARDSFEEGILAPPHYTRPERFEGMSVPEVLLSGNHERIREFRIREALKKTLAVRPDLLKREKLSDEANRILDDLMKEAERERKKEK